MDIDYLLILQNFRETCPDWFTSIMTAVSSRMFIIIGFLLLCMVYWVVDRRAGKVLLFGTILGNFVNGLLKLIFCVYRPWIRDPRIVPYGNSMSGATGYSFPSGHTTFATTMFGGLGIWLWKRRKVVSVVCFIFVALVMFSRNFLGVHTPQDVLVGLVSSLLAMWIAFKIEKWTDENPDRDKPVMVVGLIVSVAAAAFFLLRPYPMDYTADGSLLVDPAKMVGDSFQGVGMLAAYVVCRYFERRGFAFDELLDRRTRLIVGGLAIIPLAAWIVVTLTVLKSTVGAVAGYFLGFAGAVFYLMIVVPKVMELVYRRRQKA